MLMICLENSTPKNVRVKYNGVIINHLMYADDLVLFAPSSVGLSKLLRICEKVGVTHNILYNSKKSAHQCTQLNCGAIMKKCTITKLHTVYQNTFKLLAGLSKYECTRMMCAMFNVQCCQAVIRNLVYKFMHRLEVLKNSIICAIANSRVLYISKLRKHWMKLLYK